MARAPRIAGWTAVGLCVAVLVVFAATLTAAPAANDLPARVHAFAEQHHTRQLPLAEVSLLLREAVVATEDERFYRHRGVDLVAVLRAIPYDVSHFSLAQGASTIAEQLGKLLYLRSNDHSFWRKLEDAAIGMRLGRNYSHEQLLDAYLNVVYLGDGSYGVASASRRYFGRPASGLTLAQASFLAGLIQAPSRYAPSTDPRAARERQVAVLRSMVRNGYTTTAEASGALSHPLRLESHTVLPSVGGVSFSPGAPFDWAELALAIVLLAAALLLFLSGRQLIPDGGRRLIVARGASIILVLLAVIAAARSVQVI